MTNENIIRAKNETSSQYWIIDLILVLVTIWYWFSCHLSHELPIGIIIFNHQETGSEDAFIYIITWTMFATLEPTSCICTLKFRFKFIRFEVDALLW